MREHFLLGTNRATISVTARGTESRQALFMHSMNAILARYSEEFGPEAAVSLVEHLRSVAVQNETEMNWRLSDEDSCFAEVKRQLANHQEK